MNIIVGDTETTGLDRVEDKICQLAFIEISPELRIVDSFESLIDPERAISPSAAGTHGITDKDVEYAPTMEEAMEELITPRFGALKNVLLICHNVVFDYAFLKPYWGIQNTLCTMKVARKLYPDAPDHKLQTLKHYLGLETETTHDQAHTAMADTLDLFALLQRELKDADTDLFGLLALSLRPELMTTMPFGKHKGAPLENLPNSYVSWLLGLDDLDYSLRWSLEQIY